MTVIRPDYGRSHRAQRRSWRRIIDAGDIDCCLCGRRLMPGSAFDLDHAPGTADQYRGPAHPSCNRSDGATRGNKQRSGTQRLVL